MFQDEARFGRMSSPRSCWAPAPDRPLINLAIVREFRYVYGAVAPADGRFDYMVCEKMNTQHMNKFLAKVRRSHRNKFIAMVVDGASSHRSKDLVIPKNMALIPLPAYSPELNPAERIWNVLRRNYFCNLYFETLEMAMAQAERGLVSLANSRKEMKSLTCWPWINTILNPS
jgi:transposase